MTDDLTVSGGSGGIGADTDDMRATADALGRTNDDLRRIGGDARGASLSGALARTTIFSPLSAARAQAELLQAATVVTALTVQVGAAQLLLRARATLFDLADAGRAAIDIAVSMATAPLIVPLIGLAIVDRDRALRILAEHPELTDLVTGGLVAWSAILPGRPPLPTDYEGVLGLLQLVARLAGRWHGGPIAVTPDPGGSRPATIDGLADLVASVDDLASGPADRDDASAVRVVRVDGPGGPSWIVEIPGTDFAGGARDPSDGGANLSLMRGSDELMNAVLAAMAASGIGPTDRVLVTGHSQGGIAAMALASSPEAQRRYNISHVITAGSPVSRFDPPAHVRVLSIEHEQDPVPRLDTQPNPDRANWTTVGRDVGDDPAVRGDPFEAHRGSRYTGTAELIDDAPELDPLLAEFSPFFGGRASQQDYVLQREP